MLQPSNLNQAYVIIRNFFKTIFMSNPPFNIPFHSDDEYNFSFPIEPPNNHQPLIENQIILEINLPNTSLPMSQYQDLSDFFENDGDGYPDYLSNSLHDPNINWVTQTTEQVDLNQTVQQADAEGCPADDLQHRLAMMTTTTTSTTTMIKVQTTPAAAVEIGEGSSNKKLDHNAKERVRRMKLNATYSALRSLLPESRRAKKSRWSAPHVIDKALDYIPQLQSEIETLTLEKNNMLSVIGNQQVPSVTSTSDNQQHLVENDNINKTLTVSINEVKNGEMIVQICEQTSKIGLLCNLIEKLEGDGLQVISASSVTVCENRSCFHLHIQMSGNPCESDYVAILHKKIISWLS